MQWHVFRFASPMSGYSADPGISRKRLGWQVAVLSGSSR
jgi:hypothetical protein